MIRYFSLIRILFLWGTLTMSIDAFSQTEFDTIINTIGQKYLERVSSILKSSSDDSNMAFLNDVTTFSNLFSPSPTHLNVFFPELKEVEIQKKRIVVYQALKSQIFENKFNDILAGMEAAQITKNNKLFQKKATDFIGLSLIWFAKEEHLLKVYPSSLSDKIILDLLEKIGRNSAVEKVEGHFIHDPIFAAGYLIRYHFTKNDSDLFYFYASFYPILRVNYKELNNLPLNLSRKLFNFISYAVEQSQTNTNGLWVNYLTFFEEIFPSIEKHFPFHENIGPVSFGRLGVLRDKYKLIGNTKMVDKINRLRLILLSSDDSLNTAIVDQIYIKVWGVLTNYGTSMRRLTSIGLAIMFLIFLTAATLNAELAESQNSPSEKRISTQERIKTITKGSVLNTVNYILLKSDYSFQNRKLDYFFGAVVAVFYTVFVGTVFTLIIRHSI